MARYFRGMICLSAVLFLLLSIGCSATIQQAREPLKSPDLVKTHCDLIGAPRVERISEHVWVAIGYDLANVILIHTPGRKCRCRSPDEPETGRGCQKRPLGQRT